MVSAYTASRRHFYYQEQVARVQENGRHAMRLLAREVAMSGYYAGLEAFGGREPGHVSGDCADTLWALPVSPALDLVNDASRRVARYFELLD